MKEAAEITRLLTASRRGDRASLDLLLEAVYPELKKIAQSYLRAQRPGHTLQATALLHEAYLKLAGSDTEWKNRTHFYAVSATAMRQILVDHARSRQAQKRGSGARAVTLYEACAYSDEKPDLLVALDEALSKLAESDERKARILELRYFGGLSVEETAEAVGVSVATVGREARFAEAWLKKEIEG